MIPDFELAATLRAASLTVHAWREPTVAPLGDEITIEHCEERDSGPLRAGVSETRMEMGVTKVVRGVQSPPSSPT